MNYYVLGVVRDDQTQNVLVVEKNTPIELRGTLTGIIGHIEKIAEKTSTGGGFANPINASLHDVIDDGDNSYEYPVFAMVRHCHQQTNMIIPACEWILLGKKIDEDKKACVYIFGTTWELDCVKESGGERIFSLTMLQALEEKNLSHLFRDVLMALQ